MEKEVTVLVREGVEPEEVARFISRERKYPKKDILKKIEELKENINHRKLYRLFEDIEEEEKTYFLKIAQVKPIEELAETYAEMAVMLERALIVNAFYKYKLKEAKKRK